MRIGLCTLHCCHTSCSLSLNENWDPTVLIDMEMSLNRIVPEGNFYRHDDEGSDDMPAHMKSTLFGVNHTIPITNGKLVLGTWQGIYLCEHRDHPGNRSVVVTIQGTS